MILSLALLALFSHQPEAILFENATIVDGSGKPSYKGSVLVEGDTIEKIGKMPDYLVGVERVDVSGLVLAPGFIDSHSHADGGIKAEPEAKSQIFQGITTAVVGQDGFLPGSFQDSMTSISQVHPAINFAAFSGHNAIRGSVMGEDYKRASTPAEVLKMKALVEADMKSGALGLSTGLEYNPGFYSKTEEVIELAKTASAYHGSYISHMRSEDREIMPAVDELIRIAREAKLPAQVSHIKLCLPSIWGQANLVIEKLMKAKAEGLKISADIYPYTYWQSTITVITNSREWDKLETWKTAISETGGSDKILLSGYSADPTWQGKTIAQLAAEQGLKPEEIVLEIVKKTQLGPTKGSASVIVTAMSEKDIAKLISWPGTSICSDGGIGGSHPRGAGSFPRVLRQYSLDNGVLKLEDAVRRMTSLPAAQFGFKDRGLVKVGMKADLVIFDPKTITDTASPSAPTSLSKGVRFLVVGGKLVISDGMVTKNRPGTILLRDGSPFHPSAGVKTAMLDKVQDLCCGG